MGVSSGSKMALILLQIRLVFSSRKNKLLVASNLIYFTLDTNGTMVETKGSSKHTFMPFYSVLEPQPESVHYSSVQAIFNVN